MAAINVEWWKRQGSGASCARGFSSGEVVELQALSLLRRGAEVVVFCVHDGAVHGVTVQWRHCSAVVFCVAGLLPALVQLF